MVLPCPDFQHGGRAQACTTHIVQQLKSGTMVSMISTDSLQKPENIFQNVEKKKTGKPKQFTATFVI